MLPLMIKTKKMPPAVAVAAATATGKVKEEEEYETDDGGNCIGGKGEEAKVKEEPTDNVDADDENEKSYLQQQQWRRQR